MADIRCPKCGEPWDMDTLHDEVMERHPEFQELSRTEKPWYINGKYSQEKYDEYYKPVLADFRKRGCAALGTTCYMPDNKNVAAIASVIYDVMGDDIDGEASAWEDAESMGLI